MKATNHANQAGWPRKKQRFFPIPSFSFFLPVPPVFFFRTPGLGRGWRKLALASSFFILGLLPRGFADTVILSFPAALGQSTGFTDAAGGSLEGYLVRVGSLGTNSVSSILASLTSPTTSGILQQLESQFTSYDSFFFSPSFLSAGSGIFPEDPENTVQPVIGTGLRGKPVDLIFYNSSATNTASQIAIFRMKSAFQLDNADGSSGVFNTSPDISGNRNVLFDLVTNKVDALLGFINPVANRFETAILEGGVGQITSILAKTNVSGFPATYQIQANNGPDRYFATTNTSTNDLTVTTLPTGFSMSTNTGVITVATNAVAGTNTIRLVASNSVTAVVATNTLTWVLQAAGVNFTTTTNLISATAGVAIDGFTFIATGTGRTYAAAGNLRGLTFSTNTGELSGIPTSVGTNNVTIDVTADEGIGSTTFSLAVAAPTIAVPGGDLTGGQLVVTAGTARTSTVTKTANFTNLTGSVEPATTGVSFDGTSLIIATNAQPLAKGGTNVTLTLTANRNVGGAPVSAQTTVPLRIVAPVPTALVGTNEFEATLAQPFSNTLVTSAGSFARLVSLSNLPTGLIFNSIGFVNGTVSGAIATNEIVAVAVFDSSQDYEGGGILTTNVVFRLRNSPPVVTGTNRAIGGVGRTFTYSIQASNNPTRYEIIGALPPGLTRANSGRTLEGKPTAAGTYPLVLKAFNMRAPGSTNALDEQSGLGDVTLFISGRPPSLATPVASINNMTNGMVHTNTPFITTDGSMRLFAIGLPTGLFMNEYEGTLQGTNQAAGTFSVTLYMMSGSGWTIRNTTLTVR